MVSQGAQNADFELTYVSAWINNLFPEIIKKVSDFYGKLKFITMVTGPHRWTLS
jgi:hypothetical protein